MPSSLVIPLVLQIAVPLAFLAWQAANSARPATPATPTSRTSMCTHSGRGESGTCSMEIPYQFASMAAISSATIA